MADDVTAMAQAGSRRRRRVNSIEELQDSKNLIDRVLSVWERLEVIETFMKRVYICKCVYKRGKKYCNNYRTGLKRPSYSSVFV